MGTMQTTPFAVNGVTGVIDLFELISPATHSFILHEFHISQKTEVGDAQAEMIDAVLTRFTGSYTTGAGGGAGVEEPIQESGAAPTGVVKTGNTTKAIVATGVEETLKRKAFHVAAGWEYIPTPASRDEIGPSAALVLSVEVAPADTMDFRGYLVWEEIG